MELMRTIPDHWPGPQYFFADGKRITRARYEQLERENPRHDCFTTRAVSIRGGFRAWQHRKQVRPAR